MKEKELQRDVLVPLFEAWATSTLCITTSVLKWRMKAFRYQRLLI